jgi:hypothetical protein
MVGAPWQSKLLTSWQWGSKERKKKRKSQDPHIHFNGIPIPSDLTFFH